jgi:hypothetical protein
VRKWIAIAGLIAVGTLIATSIAGGAMVRVGTLVLRANGGFEPRELPRNRYVPIDFQGHAEIRQTDGSVPPPLQHVEVEFDRDGRLTTAGLPVCPPQRLEGTTPRQAQNRCRSSIVGTGHVGAAISVPGLKRVEMRSPLTLFNGPRQNGNPTVIGHAQAIFPLPETYVIVAPIEERRGTFRYRSSFDTPPIAGGFGSLTHIDAKVGRRFRAGGRERSYVSARCSDGILQTQGYFSFADGVVIYGSVFAGCRAL